MTDDRTLAVGGWFLDLITDAYESGRIDRRQYERYMDYLVRWTLQPPPPTEVITFRDCHQPSVPGDTGGDW